MKMRRSVHIAGGKEENEEKKRRRRRRNISSSSRTGAALCVSKKRREQPHARFSRVDTCFVEFVFYVHWHDDAERMKVHAVLSASE